MLQSVSSLSVVVQSASHDPGDVTERVQAFLCAFRSLLLAKGTAPAPAAAAAPPAAAAEAGGLDDTLDSLGWERGAGAPSAPPLSPFLKCVAGAVALQLAHSHALTAAAGAPSLFVGQPPDVWAALVAWLLASAAAVHALKRADARRFEREQLSLRLHHDVKLGMWSPR